VSGQGFSSSLALSAEHEIFREQVRRFFETECAPHQEAWAEAGIAPRAIWKRAGELGFLCPRVSSAFGGADADFLYGAILLEEQARSGVIAPVLSLHNDVVAPYIERYGSQAQKAEYLPRMATGAYVGAIGMTEPGAGSDLQGIKTTARRDGDDYVLRGQKTFITNGHCADLVVVAAKTDPSAAARGVSLFLLDTKDAKGFARGRFLDKLGQKASDTAELFFEDVRLPASALLGEVEGRGFAQLMDRLVEERLMTAIAAAGFIDRAIEITVQYVRERKAFGQRVLDFQNTRFRLAEAKTEAAVLRVFLERCIAQFMRGELDAPTAAALKWWSTEQQCSIVDDCVQLHGGYGYILDYPIARMWLDSRVTKIYGGSNEIMKEIIGRAL
jgi:long-chain-acyl-CoA dehydrogenase